MTELGPDKSMFWPNWVTINTQRSLSRSQRPNSVIGCSHSVTPYKQINQVGLHNYFYRYISIFTRVTSEFMGRWKSQFQRIYAKLGYYWETSRSAKLEFPLCFGGFRPPLCTYRLNWIRRTSWGWWDEWDDTALKTQDSKGLRPSTQPVGHGGSPQYWIFTSAQGRNVLFLWNL